MIDVLLTIEAANERQPSEITILKTNNYIVFRIIEMNCGILFA